MTLENYLLALIIEEKSIIEELLHIDNSVQKTNYTYAKFLRKIRELSKLKLTLEKTYHFITDGDPDTVYNVLLLSPMVENIHINNSFVALNKWLVERTKEYYRKTNQKITLFLDIKKEYNDYIENDTGIVLYGFPEFVRGIEEIFHDKSIAVIQK